MRLLFCMRRLVRLLVHQFTLLGGPYGCQNWEIQIWRGASNMHQEIVCCFIDPTLHLWRFFFFNFFLMYIEQVIYILTLFCYCMYELIINMIDVFIYFGIFSCLEYSINLNKNDILCQFDNFWGKLFQICFNFERFFIYFPKIVNFILFYFIFYSSFIHQSECIYCVSYIKSNMHFKIFYLLFSFFVYLFF